MLTAACPDRLPPPSSDSRSRLPWLLDPAVSLPGLCCLQPLTTESCSPKPLLAESYALRPHLSGFVLPVASPVRPGPAPCSLPLPGLGSALLCSPQSWPGFTTRRLFWPRFVPRPRSLPWLGSALRPRSHSSPVRSPFGDPAFSLGHLDLPHLAVAPLPNVMSLVPRQLREEWVGKGLWERKSGMCEGGVGVIMSVHHRGCAFYLFKKNVTSHIYTDPLIRCRE